MKKSSHSFSLLFALAALLLASISCIEPVRLPLPEGSEDRYAISFRVITQHDELRTKASGPLGEKEDRVFDHLFMYCFDANGHYQGRFDATLVTKEQKEYTESQAPGTFTGEIPTATARIHFVSGADRPVGGDYIGMTEKEVMNAPGLVYSQAGDEIAYWGYIRRDSSAELAELFGRTVLELVWMVRDRLWIEAGRFNDTSSGFFKEGDDPDIDGPRWVVYGGLNRGYIATFGLPVPQTGYDVTADNPFGPYAFDENNPYQELRHIWQDSPARFALSARVTPYPESGGRFQTAEADMVPFEQGVQGYQPMYLFDDACTENISRPDHVSRIIIKATFRATRNTKFFPICITHGYASEPVNLVRGHRYILNLEMLPEASGYNTFDEAAAATTFANGALVDIPDEVTEISDGQFDMRINYEMAYPLSGERFNTTAVLLHKTTAQAMNQVASGWVSIPFYVGKRNTTIGDQTFYFKESGWLAPDDPDSVTPAHTSAAVIWGTGISDDADKKAEIGSDLNSTLTLPLASVDEDVLKESTFNLKAYYIDAVSTSIPQQVHHILMRNISVYSIDRFRIQDRVYATSGNGYNGDGNLWLESLGGSVFRLHFKLPDGSGADGDHPRYPDLLYPLQIKLATRTLQPFDIHYGGQNTSSPVVFGVQVRSTEPGREPANLHAQTSASEWDYQEENNYWNFWYTYPVTSAPSGPEITIDLKDMRNSSTFSTIPGNVGLYLYIEFFGPASAVSYTQAYVPVTGVTVNPASGTSTTGHSANNRHPVPRNTTIQLAASVSPGDATYKNVTWSSSNTDWARVDANGLVTVIATTETQVDIKATTVDGKLSDTFYLRVTNN